MKGIAVALLAVVAIFFVGCGGTGYDSSSLMLEGLRTSVADAKRDQHTTTTELEILEERVDRYERTLSRASALETQVTSLDARLKSLEKKQEQALSDIRAISKRTSLTEGSIAGMKDEISSQLANMKSALESVVSLAQASQATTYTVRSGDTLERIAGREKTTVAALLKANNLTSDRIIVGQKLIIP